MAYFNRGDRQGGRRSFGGGGRDFNRRDNDRQMFKATCSNCGKACEVPFKPSDRPVFCNDCFRDKRKSEPARPEERGFSRPNFNNAQNLQYKEQFEKLNAKIDKILGLLSSYVATKNAPDFEQIVEKKAESLPSEAPAILVKKKKKASKKAPSKPAEEQS